MRKIYIITLSLHKEGSFAVYHLLANNHLKELIIEGIKNKKRRWLNLYLDSHTRYFKWKNKRDFDPLDTIMRFQVISKTNNPKDFKELYSFKINTEELKI